MQQLLLVSRNELGVVGVYGYKFSVRYKTTGFDI